MSVEQIENEIEAYANAEPVKFAQVMMGFAGRSLIATNATDASFSCNADMPDGNRYAIEVKYKIKKIKP